MKYFWLEKTLLPGEMGYDQFSVQHIISLLLLLLIGIIIFRLFEKWDTERQRRFLKIFAISMPVIETLKIALLTCEGVMNPQYLPLYVCSTGMYLFPVAAFSKNPGIVGRILEAGLLILAPGAFASLLFPNWIGYYPMFSFMSIYSYVWHGMLILFPLCAWRMGLFSLRKDSVPRAYVLYLILLPIIIVADRVLGQNYWFIERPDVNNPFMGIYGDFGYPLYIICLVLLAIAFSTCFWVIFYSLQKRRKARINEGG